MSKIIYRAIELETPLLPECVKSIAIKEIPGNHAGIRVIGVTNRKTRIRANLEDVKTSSFARFLYQVMNWEGNPARQNQ